MSNLPPTALENIHEQLERIDVPRYGSTRNYLHGAVSRLSPYISRGVILLPQLRDRIIRKFPTDNALRFIYQLAWREYFQRVWHRRGDEIFSDLKRSSDRSQRRGIPTNLINGQTGVHEIDRQIAMFVQTGYLHNHVRMYLAALSCSFAHCHWKIPSQWMYYYLLDGDIASNTLSWQWVAGTFSSKPYVFNQENLNHYSNTYQRNTFIDVSYEQIPMLGISPSLMELSHGEYCTTLPNTTSLQLDITKPLLLYNSYNLDPDWEAGRDANRVLVLEPSHFKEFPVSPNVVEFIVALSRNIPGIQVFSGEIGDIPYLKSFPEIISKQHPAFDHYPGKKTPVEWMFPQVEVATSFSSFWKKCLRTL